MEDNLYHKINESVSSLGVKNLKFKIKLAN